MALWIFGDIIGWAGWIIFKIYVLLFWVYYYVYYAIAWILHLLGELPIIGPLFELLARLWDINAEICEIVIDKLDDYAELWRDTWSEW